MGTLTHCVADEGGAEEHQDAEDDHDLGTGERRAGVGWGEGRVGAGDHDVDGGEKEEYCEEEAEGTVCRR